MSQTFWMWFGAELEKGEQCFIVVRRGRPACLPARRGRRARRVASPLRLVRASHLPPPPAPPPLQTHAQVTNLNRPDDPGGEHKVKVTGLTVAEGVKDTAQFGMFGAWGMTFDFWKHDP